MPRTVVLILIILLTQLVYSCTGDFKPQLPRDVGGLIETLRENDEVLRGRAAVALGRKGSDALEDLIAVSHDGDPKVREWSIYAISRIGSEAVDAVRSEGAG